MTMSFWPRSSVAGAACCAAAPCPAARCASARCPFARWLDACWLDACWAGTRGGGGDDSPGVVTVAYYPVSPEANVSAQVSRAGRHVRSLRC